VTSDLVRGHAILYRAVDRIYQAAQLLPTLSPLPRMELRDVAKLLRDDYLAVTANMIQATELAEKRRVDDWRE